MDRVSKSNLNEKRKSRRSRSRLSISSNHGNKKYELKNRAKNRHSISSSSSSSSTDSSVSSKISSNSSNLMSRTRVSLSPITKRKRSCNPISSESKSKNDYQQKVCLFLKQVDYDSDEIQKKTSELKTYQASMMPESTEKLDDSSKQSITEEQHEKIDNFRNSKSPNLNEASASPLKENLNIEEELKNAPSPLSKPFVRADTITVLDKFGNFRLISLAKKFDRAKVSRSSRSRSASRVSRSCSRDRRYRNDGKTRCRPRGSWHNNERNVRTNYRTYYHRSNNSERNRNRGYRSRRWDRSTSSDRSDSNRQEETKSNRRRFEKRKKTDYIEKKIDESRDLKIPNKTYLEEIEEFLARVRAAKRKRMLEENKDLLREK